MHIAGKAGSWNETLHRGGPTLGNFEGQCPSILLRGEVPDDMGFADALTLEQTQAVADYQRRSATTRAAQAT